MSLSHSCEEVSDGGPVLVGLISSSSDATRLSPPNGGDEGVLTSMSVNCMTTYDSISTPGSTSKWRTYLEHRLRDRLLVDHDELDGGRVHTERSIEGHSGREVEHGT